MHCDDGEQETREHFEVSIRFRHMIERRIARLESDALFDEASATRLEDSDHIRRQMLLVAVQREEARRMRHFLDHSNVREQDSRAAAA